MTTTSLLSAPDTPSAETLPTLLVSGTSLMMLLDWAFLMSLSSASPLVPGLFFLTSSAMVFRRAATSLSFLAYLPPKPTLPDASVVVLVMSMSGARSGSTSGLSLSAW